MLMMSICEAKASGAAVRGPMTAVIVTARPIVLEEGAGVGPAATAFYSE